MGLRSDTRALLGEPHAAVAIGGRSRCGSVADAYLIVSEIVSLCFVLDCDILHSGVVRRRQAAHQERRRQQGRERR